MHVVEDMVLAETVVSGAAGAVAEFQIGVVGVRAAADAALVPVALLGFLFLLLFHSGLELDGLVGILVAGHAPPGAEGLRQVRPEEHQEVQKGNDGNEGADKVQPQQGTQNVHGKEHRVQNGQPLHLDGNDEKQQHLGVRVQSGKGQEHGHADVIGAENGIIDVEGVIADDAHQNGQHHAGEIIEVEFRRAPLPLQQVADEVIKVQVDDEVKDIADIRHENKAHQPPQL